VVRVVLQGSPVIAERGGVLACRRLRESESPVEIGLSERLLSLLVIWFGFDGLFRLRDHAIELRRVDRLAARSSRAADSVGRGPGRLVFGRVRYRILLLHLAGAHRAVGGRVSVGIGDRRGSGAVAGD